MKLALTAKVKVIVNDSDKALLDDTMTAYKAACNFVSDYISKTHTLSCIKLSKALYYTLRERFGLKAQMAQSVLKTVVARYKSILETQHEWIKPEFKKPQYDLVWNRDYSLTDNVFSVNTLNGRTYLAYCANGLEKYFDRSIYKFGTAKLVSKRGKYFLHISVACEIPECSDSEIVNVVGIDRGINFVTTAYGSNHKTGFVSGKQIKQKRAHYKELRKQLQMRRTPSARRRLKAIGQRENRWMSNVNHCVSKALVENNPERTLFVLEDLTGIRSVTERVKLKYRYQSASWAFYDLEQKLTYKAQTKHSKVIKVNPAYTSQRCPCCGHTEKANRNKRIHLFTCRKCGYKSNDDRIGAMNLYRMGIKYLTVPDTVAGE